MTPELHYTLMSEAELRATVVGSQFCFDVECFPNFFYVAFRSQATGRVFEFEESPRSTIDRTLLTYCLTAFEVVSYNGRRYDMPMLTLCLNGMGYEQLHASSKRLIDERVEWWNFKNVFGVEIFQHARHIDLMEVVPLSKQKASTGAPEYTSLKMRAAQMHMPTIQDLPFDPMKPLETLQQVDLVKRYCAGGDLEVTSKLLSELDEQIKLRRDVSAEYKLDVMSKSDAQIAEAVIGKELTKLTGKRPGKPASMAGKTIRYEAPLWMRQQGFLTPELREMAVRICGHDFPINEKGSIVAPEWLSNPIRIGDATYQIGRGGLHSTEKKVSYVSGERLLIDRDVASYYPAMIINQGLYPETCGPAFCQVYREIRDRRLVYKAKGLKAKANSFKIVVNGGFGKLNSAYSIFYSPKSFIQVTITGQLALLMLIERIEEIGVPVISANTDGFVFRPTETQLEEVNVLISQWERITEFETEETRYKSYHARDVNNYVAVKLDGKVKGKGAYSNPWTGSDDKTDKFKKNPDIIVCIEALHAFLAHRTPLERTIRECQDPSRFAVVQKVSGGASKNGRPIGRVVRWYYSTDSPGPIVYNKNGNSVADSDGGCPIQTLPESVPPDLDFARYESIAKSMLSEVGYEFSRQVRLW